MSWSVTVNNIPDYEDFPIEQEEFFTSLHPSYARDAVYALTIAKTIGLKSATLSGSRTPNPYGGDEIVVVSIMGTPIYNDFIQEMKEIIRAGPGPESDLARHFEALARLRANPCSHVFQPVGNVKQCLACKVYLNGTAFFFEDDNGS
jgi:hypothetical protein